MMPTRQLLHRVERIVWLAVLVVSSHAIHNQAEVPAYATIRHGALCLIAPVLTRIDMFWNHGRKMANTNTRHEQSQNQNNVSSLLIINTLYILISAF